METAVDRGFQVKVSVAVGSVPPGLCGGTGHFAIDIGAPFARQLIELVQVALAPRIREIEIGALQCGVRRHNR